MAFADAIVIGGRLMDLDGKIALVTGAGSGIGRAAALKMAREGATIIAVGRTRDDLDDLAAEVEAMGRTVMVAVAEVQSEAQMRKVFSGVGERFGRLDILLANAGVNGVWAPIDELSYADWNQTVAINLGGTFLALQLSVPLMKHHGGSIIVTSSINGTRTFSSAGASAYATTKAGQLALVKMARWNWRSTGYA